jgi:hypothetical protein
VSTETLSTLTLVIADDPEEVAYDATEDASEPEEMAELTEAVTLACASPSPSTMLVVGTVTSIEIDTAAVSRRPRTVRRDPSLHT